MKVMDTSQRMSLIEWVHRALTTTELGPQKRKADSDASANKDGLEPAE